MAKKRRHAHAGARAPAAITRQVSVDTQATEKKLQHLENFYGHLSADVVEIPSSLERILVFHSIVALVVQNALMYAENVSTEQIVLVVGTGLWLMRGVIITGFLPHIALQEDCSRVVFWRNLIYSGVFTGIGAVFYQFEIPLITLRTAFFMLVFLLDVASIHFLERSKGRLTRWQILWSAIEITYLVAGFSTHLNYRSELIYDRSAFVLTAVTTFVHVVVLLSVGYTVLHCFTTDTNGKFAMAQHRGITLMESLWQSVDRSETDQLFSSLSGAPKKKKTKSKSRALKGVSDVATQDELALSLAMSKRSAFHEPRVHFAILTVLQMLLLLSQVVLSSFVLYSWEMMSALMLSSSHILWVVGRVRRKVLAHCRDFDLLRYKND